MLPLLLPPLCLSRRLQLPLLLLPLLLRQEVLGRVLFYLLEAHRLLRWLLRSPQGCTALSTAVGPLRHHWLWWHIYWLAQVVWVVQNHLLFVQDCV